MSPSSPDFTVVGGGLYGCWIALRLRERGAAVTLVEREDALLRRASRGNQARVHWGYHYPRSLLTALRSRVNAVRFQRELDDCVAGEVQAYYAVARHRSNVTSAQFRAFCARIGAPLREAPASVTRLFDRDLVESVHAVPEPLVDATRLAAKLSDQLARADVDVRLGTTAHAVSARGDRLRLVLRSAGAETALESRQVINCGYAGLNGLLARSGLPLVPLKIELAEMALVEVPPELRGIGITLMCGPFFSLLPFPPEGLHLLSHVRYTPHVAWQDRDGEPDARAAGLPRRSHFRWMAADARRFLPIAQRLVQRGSVWEMKAVLPQSEQDDSRPILFRRDAGLPGLTCVLGGKLDNIFDVERELDALAPPGRSAA